MKPAARIVRLFVLGVVALSLGACHFHGHGFGSCHGHYYSAPRHCR